jgi:tyrosyl-tRNA synthetase
VLESGEQQTIYMGFDPTGNSLHIGHAVGLRKLADFQKLGHKIIMLIGDFTAMIGDPTGKDTTRVPLTREQVLENCKQYQEQASKILAFDGENPAELRYNNDWLSKMNFQDVLELAGHFSVQQMLERDMFQRRMEAGKPINMTEFFYPMMQGYDSVVMDVTGEIGGNDQMFNMLAGRTLQKNINGKEKFVITSKLLTDSTGKKMGKSEGNMIKLSDSAEEMLGKIMSWTDGMIPVGFELYTEKPLAEIEALKQQMEAGELNPRNVKMDLAKDIVRIFFDDAAADKAEEHFIQVFKKKDIPDEIEEFAATDRNIVNVLADSGLCSSRSEARRMVEQGGVKVNGEKVEDISHQLASDVILQKGKRHFRKIV